ncbi:phytanoyl-CoA dioxygenase family protein [Pseudenhygromyxa sp. WMMC2535]|nr:phytanoyl-CoA dioxygenase family protein [Pseudenhygromyxa sp. WMMC2535]
MGPSDRRQRFEEHGYLVIPDFYPRERCDELRAAAEEIVTAIDPARLEVEFDTHGQRHAQPYFFESAGEIRAFLEPKRDAGQPRVNKLGHALHDLHPLFDRFSRDPRLAALVTELGCAEPLLLQSMVIFKGPRVGAEVLAHQDATYLVTDPPSAIGLWFALEDANMENGCLEVLPGAHREGLRSRFRREGDRCRTLLLDPRPWPEQGWQPVEVPAGTLVAFDGLLPHRSTANRSPHSRCAYTLHVIDGAASYASDNWLQRPPNMPLRGF